jgi:hypothetical protein
MQGTTGAQAEQRWEPLSPLEVKRLLGPVSAPWWIAGGYALDMFLGHETRKHAGTDIAILRSDQKAILEALRKWDVQIVHNGELIPLKTGEAVAAPEHHQLWVREKRDAPWRMEVFLEHSDGKRWSYRRNDHIGLNVADLGGRDANDTPFIRPEVMLLYKSNAPRPVDETDFLYALPRLNAAQKAWLSATVSTMDPRHRWLERLK